MRLRRARADDRARGAERERLLGLVRAGDPVALAALRADLAPETVDHLRALLLPGDPDADVVAVLTAARASAAAPRRLEAVVLALLDEGRSAAHVAEVLDLPLAQVQEARSSGLTRGGLPAAPHACRGWVLVARLDAPAVRLDAAEREAAQAHLAACRSCRAAAGAVRVVPRLPLDAVPAQRVAARRPG